jgi:uncharacterized protein YhfF
MPSYRVTIGAGNAARVIAALDRRFGRKEGEGDRQLYKRWIRDVHADLVFKDERRVARDMVIPDEEIAEVDDAGGQ